VYIRIAISLALVAVGTALGLTLGALRESTWITAAVLYSEPLPAILGVCTVHLCFARGRWPEGLGAAAGTVALLLLARLGTPAPSTWGKGEPARLDPAAAACARRAIPPESWILALWSHANDAGSARTLADVGDVVVFNQPEVDVEAAFADVGGELLEGPPGTWVWSRGGFSLCGDLDIFPVGDRSALVFAAPTADASVPLLVTDLPALGPALEAAVASVASASRSAGSPSLVVAGGGSFPTSFRLTDQRMREGNLRPVRLPPDTPSAWGRVPLLSIRAVNRVWAATSWSGRAEPWSGASAWSAPVLVRLDYQAP
jgi:hypothetical protein